MKISVLLWSDAFFGGAERRLSRLMFFLAENKNADVTIYCRKKTIEPLKSLGLDLSFVNLRIVDESRFIPNKDSKLSKLFFLFRLLVKMNKKSSDYFFIVSNPGLITFIVSFFSFKLPKLLAVMVDSTFSKRTLFLDRIYVYFTCRKFYKIDCLSSSVKKEYEGFFSKNDENKIVIAPCSFTDLSKVKISSHKNKDIDIILLSRFVPYKGHELLQSIVGELKDYSLHVCGEGEMKFDLPNAKIYQAENPFDVLSRSKVVLSLQKFNNYPSQVVLEAMASKCAIIATDVGETRMFLDEESALLIPYNSTALLIAIKSLMNDSSLREKLASNAYVKVHADHTIERYSDYFIENVCA